MAKGKIRSYSSQGNLILCIPQLWQYTEPLTKVSSNFSLIAAPGIPVFSKELKASFFDKAVETGDLSNLFAHSTSI